MRISPIINNTIYPKNNYCKNYTYGFSSLKNHAKKEEKEVKSEAIALQRSQDILEEADKELKRAGSTVGYDCYGGFQDIFDFEGNLRRTYLNSDRLDEKILVSFHPNTTRYTSFNSINLDIKTVEVEFNKSKKRNVFFYDENQHFKRAIIGEKKGFLGNGLKADEVIYANPDGTLSYFENVTLANNKGKVKKAKKEFRF